MGTPDFNFSLLTATEANYAAALLDLFRGLALGLDTTVSNPPTGAIRWSSTNKRWELYNGTSWVVLVSKYAIDVDMLDGLHSGDFALAGHNHSGIYQPLDAELKALAGLTSAANKLPYFSGSGAAALADLTVFARSILDDADAAAVRATLGLIIGTNVQAQDATLAALAALTTAADKLIYATGSDAFTTCDFPAQARTLLAATTAALQRTALQLGTAALAATGTAAGNVPVLDAGGKLVSSIIPAGVGGVDTSARDLAVRNAMKIGIAAGDAAGAFPGGYMHLFASDELATKTGATYDATGDYYDNSAPTAYANPGGTGNRTSIITMSVPAGFNGSTTCMIDGDTTSNVPGQAFGTVADGAYFQFDLGVGAAKKIDEIKWYQGAGAQTHGTWKLQGSNTSSSGYTDLGSSFSLGGVDGASTHALSATYTTGYRYFRLTKVSGSTSNGPYLKEIEFRIGIYAAANMTLIPSAITTGAAPNTIELYMLHKAVNATTLNTDLKARVTRNDGSNWSGYVTLAEVCQYDANYKLLKGTADLAALPSGTSVKWEITTLNAKVQQLRAVAMLMN